MERKAIVVAVVLLNVGLVTGYVVSFGVYQPQLSSLRSSLVNTQSMLSGWKDRDHVVASDSWFFISVAPYQNETHDCYYHTVTCEAEITNTEVSYSIEEVEGLFTVEGVGVTGNNGFIDLYLPLNKTYSISVVVNGLKGNVIVTTFADSPTCITTLKVE